MKPFAINLFGVFATIVTWVAIALIIFRWNSVSQLEKFLLAMVICLSGFAAIGFRYAVVKAHLLKEPDPQKRLEHLSNAKRQLRIMLIIFIPFVLAVLVLSVWQLLIGKP